MPTIEELLHRRSDLSTFLIHFTRPYGDDTPSQNLVSILGSQSIEARSAYGMARDYVRLDPALHDSQRVVCLTETPLEHAWMMCAQIDSREHGLAPFGIAFTKAWARRMGANPIWYLDISQRGRDWLTKPINALIDEAVAQHRASGVPLTDAEVFKLTPFIEQMGPTHNARKEFWWEREWRKVGMLQFTWASIVAVFAPEAIHESLSDVVMAERTRLGKRERPMRPLLDPTWGLERMVGALAGIDEDDAGPIPRY